MSSLSKSRGRNFVSSPNARPATCKVPSKRVKSNGSKSTTVHKNNVKTQCGNFLQNLSSLCKSATFSQMGGRMAPPSSNTQGHLPLISKESKYPKVSSGRSITKDVKVIPKFSDTPAKVKSRKIKSSAIAASKDVTKRETVHRLSPYKGHVSNASSIQKGVNIQSSQPKDSARKSKKTEIPIKYSKVETKADDELTTSDIFELLKMLQKRVDNFRDKKNEQMKINIKGKSWKPVCKLSSTQVAKMTEESQKLRKLKNQLLPNQQSLSSNCYNLNHINKRRSTKESVRLRNMVVSSLSKVDSERRRCILNKLKTIVDQLNDKSIKEVVPLDLRKMSLLCCSHSCPLPHSDVIHNIHVNGKSVMSVSQNTKDLQEDVYTQTTADFMHTKERGLNMEPCPSNVFDCMFPKFKNKVPIKISSVALGPIENVVMPVDALPDQNASAVMFEMKGITNGAANRTLGVNEKFQNLIMQHKRVVCKPNNTVLKGKKPRKTNFKMWSRENLGSSIKLMGNTPSTRLSNTIDTEAKSCTVVHNSAENALEYHVTPKQPKCVSRVQLRESPRPSWFPGYYLALPNAIKVVKSTSDVFPAAWKAVQTSLFSKDRFIIVR